MPRVARRHAANPTAENPLGLLQAKDPMPFAVLSLRTNILRGGGVGRRRPQATNSSGVSVSVDFAFFPFPFPGVIKTLCAGPLGRRQVSSSSFCTKTVLLHLERHLLPPSVEDVSVHLIPAMIWVVPRRDVNPSFFEFGRTLLASPAIKALLSHQSTQPLPNRIPSGAHRSRRKNPLFGSI